MPIQTFEATLASSRALTHDVFESVFRPSVPVDPKAGEYVMFDLAPGVKRAYSLAFSNSDGTFGLIVKRVPDGRGSPVLCDLPVGGTLKTMGPMGHFVLRETDVPKCFVGTGTGFAPLYFQLRKSAELGLKSPMRLVFGVREARDVFYDAEIRELGTKFSDFSFDRYVSREDVPGTSKGYVTEFFTAENVAKYAEFYLCGSPAMVKDARARLDGLGIPKDRVFFEQF